MQWSTYASWLVDFMKWSGRTSEEWWITSTKKGGLILKLFAFGLGKCWLCVPVRAYLTEADSTKADAISRESSAECEALVHGIHNAQERGKSNEDSLFLDRNS